MNVSLNQLQSLSENEKYSWNPQANKLLVLYNQALSQEGEA